MKKMDLHTVHSNAPFIEMLERHPASLEEIEWYGTKAKQEQYFEYQFGKEIPHDYTRQLNTMITLLKTELTHNDEETNPNMYQNLFRETHEVHPADFLETGNLIKYEVNHPIVCFRLRQNKHAKQLILWDIHFRPCAVRLGFYRKILYDLWLWVIYNMYQSFDIWAPIIENKKILLKMGFTPTFKYYPEKQGDHVGYTMTLTPQHEPSMRANWKIHIENGNLKVQWRIPESFPTSDELNDIEYLLKRLSNYDYYEKQNS